MTSVPPRPHRITQGETLTSIAGRHGMSWKALYHHDANADFRRRNPDPNRIRAGDTIMIPPDPVKLLEERERRLLSLRSESEAMFQRIEGEIRSDFNQLVVRTGQQVDTVAAVAGMGVSLTKMSADGLRIAGLTGKELADANKQFLKTHLGKGSPGMQVVAGQLGSGIQITGEEGLVWGLGKVLLKSWFDMTSPSYWASTITGWLTGQTPEQALQAALGQLSRQRAETLRQLDERLTETRSLLQEARRERNLPIPRG